MIEISDKSDMYRGEIHIQVLEECELVEKLLRWMLMLAVSCIDESRLVWETVALCVLTAFLGKPACQSFYPASYDEYRIMIAGKHVECICIAFAFVDR